MQNSNQNLSFTITVADSNLQNAKAVMQDCQFITNWEYVASQEKDGTTFHLLFVWLAF